MDKCLYEPIRVMRKAVFLLTILTLVSCQKTPTYVSFHWNTSEKTFEESSVAIIQASQDHDSVKADVDGDGIQETYTLHDGILSLAENNKTVWSSPTTWQIHDFRIADSTDDGKLDINIAAWREEDFGPSQPFWEKTNDTTRRDHFFVMTYDHKHVHALWQSSNLEAVNQEFQLADVDHNGKNELVVIEHSYDSTEACRNNFVAVWRWNQWGFTNIWRSKKGNYCHLSIENDDIVVENR